MYCFRRSAGALWNSRVQEKVSNQKKQKKIHAGAGIRMMFRFLLVLAGVGMVIGGAYILYARTQYDRRIAQKQAELCASLEKVIPSSPGYSTASSQTFPVVSVSGIDCTGILEIPALRLKLAVAASDTASDPMVYIANRNGKSGSFSIAGENRASLLGRLPDVNESDKVVFTNVYGSQKTYLVNSVYTSGQLPEGENASILNLCCPEGSGWFIAECVEQ